MSVIYYEFSLDERTLNLAHPLENEGSLLYIKFQIDEGLICKN